MQKMVETEIVIVGGGICGLATALALHRKGIKSLVLERSENLRATGAAIIVQENGWRALDQLGVGSKLRQAALQIQGGKFISHSEAESKEIPFAISNEFRCLRRADLLEAMADSLPVDTIYFGSQVLSIEYDTVTQDPCLVLRNGTNIQAKAVIGCDGVNSIVANMMGLNSTKIFKTCVSRGFTNYPNGHEFPCEFVVIARDQAHIGRIPITEKLVYWFVTRTWASQDSVNSKDSTLIRQSTLKSIENFPIDAKDMISKCELNSLHLTQLKYRPPWDLLLCNFRKGKITIAGDAMHATGPFIAQGGSASIEDAIVLVKCIVQMMDINEKEGIKKMMIEQAFDQYLKERKMRNFWLSLQSYLIGKKHDTQSSVVNFIIILLLVVLFRNPNGHNKYDCGHL